MRKDWKNIWFWVDIALFLLCVCFYLMANPVLWLSREVRASNLWYTLLALLCLAGKTFVDKKRLKEPAWSWSWGWAIIIIGTYLFFTFYRG
ncbi:MAG: hypothetical protein DBY10_05740 [Clostridiales bacterium]|jgi:hypothetical protein|nr:MAG: hypothetical protein DBY10_05740 [Clostridiales bacterium]